jgi:hypothetical protein
MGAKARFARGWKDKKRGTSLQRAPRNEKSGKKKLVLLVTAKDDTSKSSKNPDRVNHIAR